MSDVLVGQRLFAWRIEKGLTQSQLAEACDVSKSAVSSWENGHSHPSHDHLNAAVDFMELTMAEFYGPLPKRAA